MRGLDVPRGRQESLSLRLPALPVDGAHRLPALIHLAEANEMALPDRHTQLMPAAEMTRQPSLCPMPRIIGDGRRFSSSQSAAYAHSFSVPGSL